jgi:hypothetical protein
MMMKKLGYIIFIVVCTIVTTTVQVLIFNKQLNGHIILVSFLAGIFAIAIIHLAKVIKNKK